MDSEQFSLSWNDFHKNLSSGFHSLLEDSTLVDVTLAVEGRKIQAHKVVLSVCSPYFKDLFNGNPCQHPIIFLKDVNYSVIKNLLEFMYLGEVNVRQEELAEFIKTAEDLKIKGLTGSKDKHEECPPVTTQLDSPTHSTTRSGRTVTKRQSSPPASTPTPPPIRKSVPVANTSLNNSTSNKRPKPSTSTSSSLPVKKQCLEPEYIPEPAKPEHIELPNTFGNLKTEPEDYLITEDTLGDDSNLNDPADFPADDTFDNLDTEPQPGGSGEMMTMSADSKEQITQGAAFMELTEDVVKDLKIKLGSRKILLNLINPTENSEHMIGTLYQVENDGSIVSANLQQTTIKNTKNFIQPQPHCSKDGPQIVKGNTSSCFSRYGTVKKTLENHPQGSLILSASQSSFTEEVRQSLIRIVVSELVAVHNSHYPPISAKKALAKAIVAEFPRLRNNYSSEGYEHYYDENTKKGFIEFRLWTMRTKLSPSEKKYRVNKNKPIDISLDIENLSTEEMKEKILMLKFKNPTEENKSTIIQGLHDTYIFRRHWILTEQPTIADIFQMYPRLQDYHGDMIHIEFKKMFPKLNDNFISKFETYYTPRILYYAKKFRPALLEISRTIENEQLRALLILAELLPVSNAVINNLKTKSRDKSKGKGKKRLCKEEDVTIKSDFPNKFLLQLVSEDTNFEDLGKTLRSESTENIQPYLTLVKEQGKSSIFIQGDGLLLNVPESPLKAFDTLYKLFYVFNVEYPRSLVNFYNFIDKYIYKMPVQPRSVVSSLHINISNIEMDEENGSSDL